MINTIVCTRLPSSPRISIVKNRSISMIAMYILFLVGFDRATFDLSQNLCKGVAAMIHFSGLAIFSWTLLEGIQLLRTLESSQLTDTNHSKYSDLKRYIIGYGTPLILTFIALFISFVMDNDGDEYLSSLEYCWLRENSFIYFFIVPVGVVLIFNTFVFIKAVIAATRVRKTRNQTNAEKLYGQVKTWAFLSFLLGQTWATGFLIQENMQGFSYIFVILNGSSGIFLFVHTILMNDIVMLEVKIRLGLVDQVELAINRSGDRITASKSFSAIDKQKPRVAKRSRSRSPRQHQISTSSDEMPPAPRPVRKQITKRRVMTRQEQDRGKQVYTIGEDSVASTPENTSLSSNNSVNPSSFEQSSSESLYKRRDQRLERKMVRRPPHDQLQHDRLRQLQRQSSNKLQRHSSNKW